MDAIPSVSTEPVVAEIHLTKQEKKNGLAMFEDMDFWSNVWEVGRERKHLEFIPPEQPEQEQPES